MRIARTALRLVLAASLGLAGGGGGTAAPQRAPAPLSLRIGQTRGLTHIVFPGGAPTRVATEGGDLVLWFPGAGVSPDTARLVADPVALVTKASAQVKPGGLEVRLSLADGTVSKFERVDGAPTLILRTPQSDVGRDQPAAPRKSDPAPGGRLVVAFDHRPGGGTLRFPFRAPVGAAVFRRGDALWLVFDLKVSLDLSRVPPRTDVYTQLTPIEGPSYTALRVVGAAAQSSATCDQSEWRVGLGREAQGNPSDFVKISRDDAAATPGLRADMAGSTGVFWIHDPVVGDDMAVVTALAPAKGSQKPRRLVDLAVLASSQGLALSPVVDDLQVSADGDVVRFGRRRGLALSGVDLDAAGGLAGLEPPKAAAMPALVDFAGWSNTGGARFMARYADLQRRAADEKARGRAGGVGERMALARFLVGSELAFEGLGVLRMAVKADPTLEGKAEFRGLRGAARAIAGRYKDAEADFSAPVLSGDPASAVWRGYVDERLGDHQGARQQFLAGRSALGLFPEKWRGRFARMDAEAALETGDLGAAGADVALARTLKLDRDDAAAFILIAGRLAEARGAVDEALGKYDAAAASNYGAVSAPAMMRAVQLRLATRRLAPRDAEPILASLRFRWRGDGTELEIVRALGKLYLAEGRYRDALQTLRSANGRLPELATSVAISQDLAGIFKSLFLDGLADGLPPIQALGLFFDFKDLAPIGADGDAMVRKLARRLVDVDLLDQAAELLKYQADNRLDGVPRAEVDTDLAMVQLMNRKPEAALAALNASRTTLLPTALNSRRRVIEARAQSALGRYDAALELLQGLKDGEALSLRADIAWRQRNWPLAGSLIEQSLGDRFKRNDPLTPSEQSDLVRAGAAYSLAGDDGALSRLRQRYGRFADGASSANVLHVALEGVDSGKVSAEDFRRLVTEATAFEGWIQVMKRRFETEPTPISAPSPPPKSGAAKPGAARA